MNIYDKNIRAKNKGKALIVEPSDETLYPSLSFPVIIENLQSKSGLHTAKVKTEEHEQGIFIHSSYDPQAEARKKADSLDLNKNTLIVVYGIGLGYYLFELQKRISKRSKVLVIENSMDIFNNVMKSVDLTKIFEDKRFCFLIDLNIDQVCLFFQQMLKAAYNFHLASNVQFVNSNYYERLFPGTASSISKYILSDLFNTWTNLGNSPGDVILGLMNNFKNIDEAINNPSIKQLKDSYKDKPAIIVSAGPSLDKNIDLLKEVEGKALILATEVTLRALVKRGIRPDAVFVLERIGVYKNVFENRDFDIPQDVVLSVPIVIEPKVFKEFEKNKKVIGFREKETINVWLNKVLGDKGAMFMGSSVSHLAMGFALEVGANPIILIGQDLAFSETGKTHGGDIDSKVKDATINLVDRAQNIAYVEDYNGKPIKSTTIWKNFLIMFENKILESRNRKFIDATEGGARIKGTEIMTLREVIDKYIKHQVIQRLNEMVPEAKSVEDKRQTYSKLIEALREKRRYFQNIRKLSGRYLRELRRTKRKYEDRYESISINENREIRELLSKADEIYSKMKREELSVLFFQSLFSSTIYRVNALGLEATNENVWENVLLEEDFLFISQQIATGATKSMRMIQAFLRAKIERYPEEVDPDRFMKYFFRV